MPITQAQRFKIRSTKNPTSISKEYIGIELEFYSTMSPLQCMDIIVALELEDDVNLGSDSSIEWGSNCDRYFGYELRILTTEENLPKILDKVQDFLVGIDAEFNNSCGLHVHLDMRKRNKEEVYSRLVDNVEQLKIMVPKFRRDNQYCSFNTDPIFRKYTKYTAINFNARRPTIEIRCREMTTCMIELYEWVLYLINLSKEDPVNEDYVNRRVAQCASDDIGIPFNVGSDISCSCSCCIGEDDYGDDD